MDAERFPITTPYGQVVGYPLNNGYHRGEDRAMPMDTPVLVNGHEIGLSGNSGQVTGPHLHIGRFVGGGDTPPNGGGFHFAHAVVTEISEDAVNGKFVRIQADGASWVYLHLSRQSVPVGQELLPVAPAPTHPFTVVPLIAPEQLVTVRDCYSYNLDYTTDVDNRPYTGYPSGTRLEAVASAYHNNGEKYFMTDATGISGFRESDVTYWTEPAPIAVSLPPAAPTPLPVTDEQYKLLVNVLGFATANQAIYHSSTKPSNVNAGKYMVYTKHYPNNDVTKEPDAINITRVRNMPGWWINPLDNVAEPSKWDTVPTVVTPNPPLPTMTHPPVPAEPVNVTQITPVTKPNPNEWKSTISALGLNGRGEYYISGNAYDITIKDVSGNSDMTTVLHPDTDLFIVKLFWKDGVHYGLTKNAEKIRKQTDRWLGVPMSILTLAVLDNGVTDIKERFALGTARWDDYAAKALGKFEKVIDGIIKARKVKK